MARAVVESESEAIEPNDFTSSAPGPDPAVEAATPVVDEYAVTYEPRPYADALTDAHRKVLEDAGQLPDLGAESSQPRRVEDDL